MPFSIFSSKNPFYSPNHSARRPSGFALHTRKSRSQGLATLTAAFALRTLEASFSVQRSWASPFRAFHSSPVIRPRFPKILSAPALPCITSAALHRRLSGLLPPEKLYPFLATQRVNPGRGRLLSWAFRLPRFSPFLGGLKRLSLFKLPSCSFPPRASQPTVSRASGFYIRRRSAFPPKGRLPA